MRLINGVDCVLVADKTVFSRVHFQVGMRIPVTGMNVDLKNVSMISPLINGFDVNRNASLLTFSLFPHLNHCGFYLKSFTAFFRMRSAQSDIGKSGKQYHIILMVDITLEYILIPVMPV